MTSAISTSLAGVQSATQKLNVAAEEIVTSGLSFSGVTDLETKQITRNSKSGNPVRAETIPLPDMVSSAVDLKRAEISYKASALALKVSLEIDKNLIDQIG